MFDAFLPLPFAPEANGQPAVQLVFVGGNDSLCCQTVLDSLPHGFIKKFYNCTICSVDYIFVCQFGGRYSFGLKWK